MTALGLIYSLRGVAQNNSKFFIRLQASGLYIRAQVDQQSSKQSFIKYLSVSGLIFQCQCGGNLAMTIHTEVIKQRRTAG